MEIFLVGGAVRDELLGYPSVENDWVVVGARTQQLIDLGFSSVGKDFPVFLHPETKEEYALARKERKSGKGYTGFEFDIEPHVSLEDDLSRRDLTINAIARRDDGTLVDPYGGVKDIKAKLLRHVSPAFCEDPVRVLRLARFAARYHHLGFTVAPETIALAREMAASGELDYLVAERVWNEMEKALGERNPHIFVSVLRECHALKTILPELDALFGVPQPEAHHPEIDTGVHCLMVLEQASLLSDSISVRFASLVHDLGKALTPKSEWPKHHGHEQSGLAPLDALCSRLKAPNESRELALLAMRYHTHCHRAYELRAGTILKLLKSCDAFRRPARFYDFLLCCKADARGRLGFENRNYSQANFLAHALELTMGVDAKAFVEKGLKGKQIGEAIDKERLSRIKKLVTKKPQTEQ